MQIYSIFRTKLVLCVCLRMGNLIYSYVRFLNLTSICSDFLYNYQNFSGNLCSWCVWGGCFSEMKVTWRGTCKRQNPAFLTRSNLLDYSAWEKHWHSFVMQKEYATTLARRVWDRYYVNVLHAIPLLWLKKIIFISLGFHCVVHFAQSTRGGEGMEGNIQGCSSSVDKKV